MSTPLLTSALQSIRHAMDHAGDAAWCSMHLEDAYAAIADAIEQVNGAREDAARMSGRVRMDTELLNILTPKPTLKETLHAYPRLLEALLRFASIDANGATLWENDIEEALDCASFDPEQYTRELIAASDRLEREGVE